MTTSLTTPFLILDKQQVRSSGTDIYLFHCCKCLRNKVKKDVYENKEQCCGIINAALIMPNGKLNILLKKAVVEVVDSLCFFC